MGFGLPELIIVFIIVILVFGTKKLRGLGGDLGSAIKSFRSAVKEDEDKEPDDVLEETQQSLRNKADQEEQDKDV